MSGPRSARSGAQWGDGAQILRPERRREPGAMQILRPARRRTPGKEES